MVGPTRDFHRKETLSKETQFLQLWNIYYEQILRELVQMNGYCF